MPDPRVRVSLSCTVSTGNYSSVRLEVMEERDVSSLSNEGQTRAAILERLKKEVEEWKKTIPVHPIVGAMTGTEASRKVEVQREGVAPSSLSPSKPVGSVAAVTDKDPPELAVQKVREALQK